MQRKFAKNSKTLLLEYDGSKLNKSVSSSFISNLNQFEACNFTVNSNYETALPKEPDHSQYNHSPSRIFRFEDFYSNCWLGKAQIIQFHDTLFLVFFSQKASFHRCRHSFVIFLKKWFRFFFLKMISSCTWMMISHFKSFTH